MQRVVSWQIESLSEPGCSVRRAEGNDHQNEDRWIVRESVCGHQGILLVGVIDGANPLVTPDDLPEGVTAGTLAAEEGRKALLDADQNQSLKSVLLDVNRRIRQVSICYGVDYARPETLWAVAASVARVSTLGRLEYAHIADTVILLATAGGEIPLSRDQVGSFDCMPLLMMQEARRRGVFDPNQQAAFAMPAMIEEKALANAPGGAGYGALNGMEDHLVEEYIEEGDMKLSNEVRFIALLTDGILPPLTKTDQVPDWKRIVNTLDSEGLAGLLSYTRRVEKSDPWLERPRVKMHDDATGVLIRLHWDDRSAPAGMVTENQLR